MQPSSSHNLFGAGVLIAALYLIFHGVGWFPARLLLKGIPVLLMLAWIQLHAEGAYARLVQVGLGFSFFGDVFLVFTGPNAFVAGLGSFLLAHVLYIAAFLTRTKKAKWELTLPYVLWIAVLLFVLWSSLKEMKVPVIVYALTIAAMMWRASCLWVEETVSRSVAKTAIVGAALFGISDSIIAVDKFYARGPFPWTDVSIMVLYWSGQLGITFSTRQPSKDEGGEA